MNTFKRISESIEDLSGHQIIKKKRRTILPVIYIIGGLILMWWGIANWSKIGYVQTSYILVFGGLFIVGWGIVMLTFNTHFYIVSETQEPIKPQTVYLNPDNREIIEQLMKSGNLAEVLKHSIKTKSPLMLEVWQANGHKLLYSQLLYNKHAHIEPVSDTIVSDKTQIST